MTSPSVPPAILRSRLSCLTPSNIEYIRRLDVVNRGFSGYNTNQAVQVIDRIIPDPSVARVRFLVIFFGANDSCLKGAVGSQHVPLEDYKRNLEVLITNDQVREQKPRTILVTPPPIEEYSREENDRAKGIPEPRRRASYTKLYADATREVGVAHNVTVLDLYAVFMRHAGQSKEDSLLEGSKEKPPNAQLRRLLHDGKWNPFCC